MSTTAITRPLPGERVLELSPDSPLAAAQTWLRRPNLFAGRALTAPTLEARSRWAAGRLAQRGQAYTAGVVHGLEVGFETRVRDGAARAEVRVHIAAGHGLAASGEDVALTHEIEADLWSLPVVAPPTVFEGGGFGGGGVLQPREVRSSLGALISINPDLPRAGVLMLQPVTVERADIDPEDPCDRCGCAEGNVAYEDWRDADGARLLWYAWPQDWRPLPAAGEAFRNRLAHLVFDAERQLAADAVLPWEPFGVPIALFGMDGAFLPLFADRASVVRRGGRARHSRLQVGRGSRLAASTRLPALWQAQIEQLAEQIGSGANLSAATLARAFERLPPCGLLRRDAIDLSSRRSVFFPESFDLDAVPVPLEQLDLAIRESAGLASIDFSRGERLRVLVPVSQASWEPRLLLREAIAPEFEQTVERFVIDRARALAHRQGLRLKAAVLLRAMRGEAPTVPAIEDDPQALEPESIAGWGPPQGNGGHRAALRSGLHAHGFKAAGTPLVAQRGDALYSWAYLDPDHPPRTLMLEWRSGGAQRRAYWGENLIELGTEGRNTRLRIGELPEPGRWVRIEVPAAQLDLQDRNIEGMGFLLFDGRVAYGAAGRVSGGQETPWFDAAPPAGSRVDGDEPFETLGANELLAPFEPRFGVMPATVGLARLATDASTTLIELEQHAQLTGLLSGAEQAQLRVRGVEGFIAYLKSRADRTDDIADTGFVKVQTDLYRLRQLVLNATDASRLAISPALAGIAKAETAVATREDIAKFLGSLRATQATSEPEPTPAPGGSTTRSANLRDDLSFAAQPRLFDATRFDTPFDSQFDSRLESRSEPIRTTDLSSRMQTDFSTLQSGALYASTDVTQAAPLVGKFDIRTLSIAERLQLPKAEEARDYATSTRHEAVFALLRLADELRAADGGELPGLFEDIDVWGLVGDFGEAIDATTPPRRSLRQFIAPVTGQPARSELLGFLLQPPRRMRFDEATHFSDSTDLADRTVALLRQVEGRVARYRAVIALCEAALKTLRGDLTAVGLRERVWADALAEARHDVAVTRALVAEEHARIDGINARRAAVLEKEVQFLAFLRPRSTDARMPAVSRSLDPGLLEAPVPACLRAHADVPEELTNLLAVLREAPAAWFGQGRLSLDALDRVDLLVRAVQTAQQRAPILAARERAAVAVQGGVLAGGIAKVRAAQTQSIASARTAGLQLNLSRLGQLNWQGLRVEAAKIVSLGDLMQGDRGAVSRQASTFFDRFEQVTVCLHAGFSEVPPSIRLDWAETLSQFDKAPRLRNLTSLARWSELEFADRRRMQGLVDWMFDQLDTQDARALSLVNDVVRMCLLLASHAPIGRILAGRLPRPVLARPGLRIPLLALDPARLRVGMQALVYRAEHVIARAVVEDLGAEVSARVIQVEGPEQSLAETDRVQFADAASVSLAIMARVH